MARRAILLAVPVGLVLANPASSANFFEVLFGLAPAAPPVYAPRRLRRDYLPRKPSAPRPHEPAAVATPNKPKPMGEIDNPVPKLLSDITLRPGDIVVFPDGPRIFKGQPGSKHQLDDFEPVAAGITPSRTRKIITGMQIGTNDAWSEEFTAKGKLAGDVDSTGSVRKRGRR
jgi:hypothetical protein